jgi:AraC family transcriptional regulator
MPDDQAVFADCRRTAQSFPAWPGALAGEAVGRILEAARIEFVSAAEWRWNEGRSIPRRRLPTTSIGYQYAGSGRMRLAGREHRLASPCLQLVPAGLWHDVRHDPGRPLSAIGLHFQAPLPGGGELAETLGFPPVVALDPSGRDRPLVEAMHELARLDAHRPPGWRLLGRAGVVRVLMHLVLHHGGAFRPVAPSASLPARLAPALAMIERDLAGGAIRIGDLAAAAGVSAVHLRTLFRRTTGRSPHRYVQSRRIALACRLLREEEAVPVGSIAERVGLSEPRVFHRLFKAFTGTTPGRWRTEM